MALNKELDVIVKGITLLYREHTVPGGIDNKATSKDLIKNILQTMKADKLTKLSGGDSDIMTGLKELLTDMAGTDDGYDKLNLTQSLKMLTADKPELTPILLENIELELSPKETSVAIAHLKKFINNYYRAFKLKKLINILNFKLGTGKIDISDINQEIATLQLELDTLNIKTNTNASDRVEVDFNNVESLTDMLEKVKEELSDYGKLKTGWKYFNEMIDNGFKRGEFTLLAALQHKYKSGTVGSFFCHIPMFNEPKMLDPDKKPLVLLHSLEDDAGVVLNFIYKHIYSDEFGKLPDMNLVTSKEITTYIIDKLTRNGYHVKIIREDPTRITYKDLYNTVTDLEADGYEIHAWIVDYLALVPTTGCITTGPIGTDMRDLFRRLRNFCGSRKIAFITPTQLSTDAKQLIRNGVKDLDFVKEVANKGYFANSRQLDQEVDLEVYQHIGKHNKKAILTFQRGKHRGAPIIDESKMYFGLYFPDKAPIGTDINKDINIGWRPGETEDDTGLDF